MFGYDKVKLLLVVDVKVIVRFLFKRPFSRMKSNLKDTSLLPPKGLLKFQKIFLKKAFTYPNTLITVYFHSHSNKRPSRPPRSVTKRGRDIGYTFAFAIAIQPDLSHMLRN